MKALLLVLLACTPAVAQPKPAPARPVPEPKPLVPACEVKGTPVFEIVREDTTQPKWRESAKLYETGAWQFAETTADGKPGKTNKGCVAEAEMKTLKDELAAAKWKITVAKIKCMAMSPKFTLYRAHNKDVFESHVCGGKTLDEASQKAVDDLEKQLAVAFPKP